MWDENFGCKIQRSGSPGSYTYSVAADRANRPVNYVSWGDAARFANWLHNGQPTGAQDLTTTEDRAYYLNGATSNSALMAVGREGDWKWAIPTEDEWYKAAYYKGGGTNAGYWDYPTQSDMAPTAELPPATDMVNGSANYSALDTTYWTMEVGAYTGKPSVSAYGTFDQGGNLWEWNETPIDDYFRGLRGGSFDYDDDSLHASTRISYYWPLSGYYDAGFRLVNVPEPSTFALLTMGAVGLLAYAWWKRHSA